MSAGVVEARTRYDNTAIAAHWLLAALILVNLGLGLYMSGLPLSPRQLVLFNWHKWVGVTILMLSALRLLWRMTHHPPPDVPMPRWQRIASHAVHRALYALFFVVPLAGWGYSSATGFPVVWFGVLPLPDWVPVDRAWADALKALHQAAALTLALLVALHVAAALKHLLVDRDGLLQRMRPFRR
ncbi:MAG TPA: cytochrome b [Burkholderiaceae bacterium]|nr:cytochrome b [Burkholderiaceae bacterium]